MSLVQPVSKRACAAISSRRFLLFVVLLEQRFVGRFREPFALVAHVAVGELLLLVVVGRHVVRHVAFDLDREQLALVGHEHLAAVEDELVAVAVGARLLVGEHALILGDHAIGEGGRGERHTGEKSEEAVRAHGIEVLGVRGGKRLTSCSRARTPGARPCRCRRTPRRRPCRSCRSSPASSGTPRGSHPTWDPSPSHWPSCPCAGSR